MSSQASPSASPDQSRDNLAGDHYSSLNGNNSDTSILSQESSKTDSEALGQHAELERHPKGKRKRTAAKDKAVLEAAYAANPKPDKAARLNIVNRVSLNEKEVQIWFQNRRQNDRRKSRPLTPQEIAALRYGGMQILSDPLSSNPTEGSQSSEASPVQSQAPQVYPAASATSPTASVGLLSSAEKKTEEGAGVERGSRPARAGSLQAETPSAPQHVEPGKSGHRLSQSFSSTVGYLANRWNPGSSFSTPTSFSRPEDDSPSLGPFASSCPAVTSSAPVLPLPQSSSQVRLRLSLEGKAEVVLGLPSPDRIPPPRPSSTFSDGMAPHLRRPSLQRSHSAQSSVTLPPISALTASLRNQAHSQPSAFPPPRLNRGRSRNVHAWEFACDADRAHRNDELTAQAESESSGSAIAAISLLRSTSATGPSSILQPNSTKRNASAHRHSHTAHARLAKKPKLGRASSSIARLQTGLSHTAVGKPLARHVDSFRAEKDYANEKKPKGSMVAPGGNDSDKENWSPDEDGNPQMRSILRMVSGRRPLPTGAPKLQPNPRRTAGRALEEHRGPAFLGGSRANTAPVRSRRKDSGVVIFEDTENSPAGTGVADDEVERFMRGEVSPSKKGDMDCVAGLLSLSQGNWR